jgi:serine/threonine protein kinase
MQLKCPRCSVQFDAPSPAEAANFRCPKCSAKLRLRPRTDTRATSSQQTGVKSSSPQKDITLPQGTKLGGFELKRVLGRGGMATVYKAVQLSLNRSVAVKLLAARFASNSVFVERFNREAGALAALNHPNIVNIIDKGVQDNKYYYFVMEYVEGITLDQLLHAVDLNEKHYVHLIIEISKALSYVHGKGIIHRDIKPSNILVDKPGNVKVSDFGIAHIAEGDMPTERLGRNATVGTMNYMAPEQAANPGAVDVRADVYSLGVTFYKMFTKQLPVGDWKPPSMLNSNIPKAVDRILARAVQPDPKDRYATVKEFCEELSAAFAPAGTKISDMNASAGPANIGAFTFGATLAFPGGVTSGSAYATGTDASEASQGSATGTGALFVPESILETTGTSSFRNLGTAAQAAGAGKKSSRMMMLIAIAAITAAVAAALLATWYLS